MATETLLNQLREVADSAHNSENLQEGMTHLAEAFSLFSQETRRLEIAYSKLHKRFKAVNAQLEESHRQLADKIGQLDVITHYLNSILRHMNQGILFIGLEGMITTYNVAAEKILSISHKSVIFQSYWDIFPDTFFGFSMKDAFKKLVAHPLSFVTVDDKELEISTSFVRKSAKSHQGMILLIRDITEMHRLQKETGRKRRMQELGEMAASVAHEIRNPLGGIQGYASLLYKDLEKAPPLQQMAGYILEGSKHLTHLVEEVLDYARPLQLHKEPINLMVLLKKVLDFIRVDPQFPDNVKIDFQMKESSLLISLDEELFRAALLNLFFNAVDAMPRGGTLKVHVSQGKEKVFILIADTGKGIEPKHLEKIFTPYFTTKKKGNGLGLCETYKIVEAHFGTIEVESKLNEGTSFTIALPLNTNFG
jgi:PAS domain S-box-containing protein